MVVLTYLFVMKKAHPDLVTLYRPTLLQAVSRRFLIAADSFLAVRSVDYPFLNLGQALLITHDGFVFLYLTCHVERAKRPVLALAVHVGCGYFFPPN